MIMKYAAIWIAFAAILLLLDLIIPKSDYSLQFWSCIILSNIWMAVGERND